MEFFTRLADRIDRHDTVLSVGLDTDPNRIPAFLQDHELPQWAFNRRIIDATHDHAAVYKPNLAFYESEEGWRSLTETVAYANGKDVPVVLDGKRADIGNTARYYAKLLDIGDAITVNPFMGRDSLEPFLAKEEAGVFVLCRTSNKGGGDIQDLTLDTGQFVYERVAELAADWDTVGNVGLVVGATAPDELEQIREVAPSLPFLVPGVGAQGGDVEAAVEYGITDGVGLVNSSRGIIYAQEGEEFAQAAGAAAKQLKTMLNTYR